MEKGEGNFERETGNENPGNERKVKEILKGKLEMKTLEIGERGKGKLGMETINLKLMFCLGLEVMNSST